MGVWGNLLLSPLPRLCTYRDHDGLTRCNTCLNTCVYVYFMTCVETLTVDVKILGIGEKCVAFGPEYHLLHHSINAFRIAQISGCEASQITSNSFLYPQLGYSVSLFLFYRHINIISSLAKFEDNSHLQERFSYRKLLFQKTLCYLFMLVIL
jgi:hypothetical protein